DLDRLCVLLPPDEAKGKKHWRVIRLNDAAADIIRRRMGGRTEGFVFLNAEDRPWTAYAMNCRFCRLKKHTGVKHFAYAWRHGFANRKLIQERAARKPTEEPMPAQMSILSIRQQ